MKKRVGMTWCLLFWLSLGCQQQVQRPLTARARGVSERRPRVHNWIAHPPSFSTAKKWLFKIYLQHHLRTTFYCGCRFDGRSHQVDLSTCPQVPVSKRGQRVEWEHRVPASRIGHRGWSKKDFAKRCENQPDPPACTAARQRQNNRALSNPYNLVPSSGAANLARSNRRMVELSPQVASHQLCSLKLADHQNLVEPAQELKGRIGRTYLYMDRFILSGKLLNQTERKEYQYWSQIEPVTQQECQWQKIIWHETQVPNLLLQKLCQARFPTTFAGIN